MIEPLLFDPHTSILLSVIMKSIYHMIWHKLSEQHHAHIVVIKS